MNLSLPEIYEAMQLQQWMVVWQFWKLWGVPFLQDLIDVEGDGMADMVFRCIQEMDIDNRMMVLGLFVNTSFHVSFFWI